MTRMKTASLSRSSCVLGGRLPSPVVCLNAGRVSRAASSASTGRASTSTRTIELSSSVREAIDQDDDLQQVLQDEQIGPLLARLGNDLPDPTGRKEYVRPELRRLRYLFDQADIDIHTLRASLGTLASLGDTQDGFSPPASTSAPPRARLSQDSSPLAPSDPPARPGKVDQKVAELKRGIARCRTLLDESPADHPKRTAWTQTIADFRCFLNNTNRKIQVAQKDRASIQQNLKYKLAQAPEDDPKRALWENEVDRVTNKIKMEQARLRVIKTAASAPKSDVGPPKPAPPLASSSTSASETSPSSVIDTVPTPAPASTSNSSPDLTVDPAPGPTSSNTASKPRRVDGPTTSWADVFNQAWDEPSKSTATNTTRETPAEHTSGAEAVQLSRLLPDQSEPAESQSPSEEVESDANTTTPLVDSARETASDLATSASETVAEVQEVVAEKVTAAKEAVLDAASSAKGTVEETVASVKESATEAAPETAQAEPEKNEEAVQVEQGEPMTIEVTTEPELAPEAEVVAQEAEEQVVEATEKVSPAADEAEAEVIPEAIPAAAEAEAEVEHVHAPTSLDPILEHVREAVEEKEEAADAKAAEEETVVEEKVEQVEPTEVEQAVFEDVLTAPSATEPEVTAKVQPKEAEAEVEQAEVLAPQEEEKKSRGWFGGMFGR